MSFEYKPGKKNEQLAKNRSTKNEKQISEAKQRLLSSFEAIDEQGLTLRKELLPMKWADVIDLVVEDCSDDTIKARRRELLEAIDPEQFIKDFDEHTKQQLHSFSALRGLIFEALVLREFNENEDNSLLADFLLQALRYPKMVGIKKNLKRKNPDHLAVVVDREKGIAYITGIMEVKITMAKGKRFKEQLENFYGNLEEVIEALNKDISDLKDKYDLDFLPENGIQLLPFKEMKTLLVRPLSLREKLYFEPTTNEDGWEYRRSIIGQRDAEWITAFMMNLARERSLVTKAQERQMKLS